VNDGVAVEIFGQQGTQIAQEMGVYILRKDLDGAAPEPFVANTTHSIFGDGHSSIAAPISTRRTIAKAQLRLLPKGKRAAQTSYDPAFVDDCVCRTYPAPEV